MRDEESIAEEFQKYVILDSNETGPEQYELMGLFQKYVILDSNETLILD